MKKAKTSLIVIILLITLAVSARAMVVYDPINAAYNEIRNALMTLQHAETIKNAIEQLLEAKKTFEELKRVNAGVDDIIDLFLGDFKSLLYTYNPSGLASLGFNLSQAQTGLYQSVNGASGGTVNYKGYLDAIFGEDPKSETKPYITQEELFAADGYRWAGDIKQIIDRTIDAGEDISRAAQTSSPKGSARLTADALGKIIVTQAQIQQNQSKLIELGATQIEQSAREEKYYERERIRFMYAFNRLLDEIPSR